MSSIALATCSIVGRRRDGRYTTATAFFIGPTTLLTAGHSVAEVGKTIWAQLPGLETCHPNPSEVFQGITSISRFPCYVKERLYAGSQDKDIAILKTEGFRGAYTDKVELDNGIQDTETDLVYVIGYPGEYSMSSIQAKYASRVKSVKEAFQQALIALPPFELAVTCGKLITGGENPVYKASTIAGMSGSPVVFKGKVVGDLIKMTALIPGVHAGCVDENENYCVALSNERVRERIKRALGS